jgi:hypothetical protein
MASTRDPSLDDRLLRLFSPKLPSGRLPDIARLVHREGHQVSVNYITPLGPVMKGRGGPESTEDSRSYPPSFAEAAPSGRHGARRPEERHRAQPLTRDLTPAPWSSSGFWVDCSTVGEGVLSTFVTGQESADLDPDPDTWGKDP